MKNLINNIILNGGGTFNKNFEPVKFGGGFQVGKKNILTGRIEELENEDILKNIKLNAGEFLGLWLEKGILYIDISEHIEDLEHAKIIGQTRKEISIFDWAHEECIYL